MSKLFRMLDTAMTILEKVQLIAEMVTAIYEEVMDKEPEQKAKVLEVKKPQ